MAVSCDDGNDWKAGPQPAANNPGVYFDGSTPRIIELGATAEGVLRSETASVPVKRDEAKASNALQVPVKIRYAASNLTVTETVSFEAGSSSAELKVTIGEFQFGQQYAFAAEIDENYSNPYKNDSGGSSRIDAKVEVVCLLGRATFTPTDYSGSNQPQFIPFEHNIYDNQDGTYTIKNFLYNNAGYNFSFSIDENNNIRPLESNGYHSTDENRWYFYSENNSKESSRIPCYIPGADPDDFVEYLYFYTAENTSSYTAFRMDLSTKTGRMMGYSRYNVSSSGRIAFNFTWE
jgi:hypothetical protein